MLSLLSFGQMHSLKKLKHVYLTTTFLVKTWSKRLDQPPFHIFRSPQTLDFPTFLLLDGLHRREERRLYFLLLQILTNPYFSGF